MTYTIFAIRNGCGRKKKKMLPIINNELPPIPVARSIGMPDFTENATFWMTINTSHVAAPAGTQRYSLLPHKIRQATDTNKHAKTETLEIPGIEPSNIADWYVR